MGRHARVLSVMTLGPSETHKVSTDQPRISKPSRPSFTTRVHVTPEDTLDCAQRLYKAELERTCERPRIAVLNMANPLKPGLDCSTETQEETLLKRTNLATALTYEWYPLRPLIDVLYTAGVTCVRNHEYDLLPSCEWFTVDVMTVCAHQFDIRPATLPDDVRRMTQQVVDLMFETAYTNGATVLVLGAFGCGMFQNPACDIAAIFNTALAKYAGKFDQIVFAVYDSKWYEEQQVPSNFNVFKQLICTF